MTLPKKGLFIIPDKESPVVVVVGIDNGLRYWGIGEGQLELLRM